MVKNRSQLIIEEDMTKKLLKLILFTSKNEAFSLSNRDLFVVLYALK